MTPSSICNLALYSSLLLAPLALAIPPGSVRAARRNGGHSLLNDYLEQPNGSVTQHPYDSDWAGAVLTKSNNTVKSVTDTLTVPTPQGAQGSSAAAWVGIDGDSCNSVVLQTGVTFTVSSNGTTYQAWYEWYPAPSVNFNDIAVTAGDVVRLTVTASSLTTGSVTIENLTMKSVTQSLTSDSPLCCQNAEWIVEDYTLKPQQVPFANFGTVTFTNTEAAGSALCTLSEATIYNVVRTAMS